MMLDFTKQSAYFWALLPEIVLSLWAMLVLLVDVFQKGNRSEPSRPLIPWLALAGLVVTAVANAWLLRLGPTTGEGLVAVDGFRVYTNYLFLAAGALSILVSIGYLDRHDINRGEFYVLMLFAIVGMMLLGASHDLVLLFLAYELMSIAVYVLTGFNRRDPRSAEGALKYFLLGAFSSAFLLYGIALVWGASGSTNLGVIAPHVGAGLTQSPMFLIGVALLLVGLGFKVAAIPFHMWAPDAYDGAPTPVTGFMATAVKAAAFAAFIRVFSVAFAGAYEAWYQVIGWMAVLTMVVANVVALTQGSVKRMLAYSSVAHAGYLLVALVSASAHGAAAFLFYLLAYTVTTVGAFGIVLVHEKGTRERASLDDYAGYGWQQPLLAACFSIFLFSLAGFPLTGGFIGKLYILRAAIDAGHRGLAVILVLTSVISYFYYLRVIVVMYMRPAPAPDAHADLSVTGPAKLAIVAAGVAVLVLFFLPDWFLSSAQSSVASLFAAPGAFFGMRP